MQASGGGAMLGMRNAGRFLPKDRAGGCHCWHAGMEAAIANMLEPGETIVVGNNGIWGQRVTDLAARYGGAGL